MPIYEYVCRGCGKEIEVIQRFSDLPLELCTSCSGHLEKKISVSSFHLKGSGWYVTDYARKNSGSPSDSPTETVPAASSKNGNGNGSGSDKPVAETPAAAKSEAKVESKEPKSAATHH